MLLVKFFEDLYVPFRLRGKSPNTVRLYYLCIDSYSKSLGKIAHVSDLTNENILLHLAKRTSVAPATRNKELNQLNALWKFAIQKKQHEGWPEVQLEPVPQRIPQAWTQTEMQKILEACKQCDGYIEEIPAWIYWQAIVRTVFDTGERIGAVRSARWEWLSEKSLLIPAESRKGGKRDKWFMLSDETMTLLRELKKRHSHPIIFPWVFHYTYFWKCYQRLLTKAGLPTGRNCGFHRIRKTTASVAHAAGLDAQDVLDHCDRRTTQRYLDPRFTAARKPSEVLADWLAGNATEPKDAKSA